MDTGSSPLSRETPSTQSQWNLLRLLQTELTGLGCTDIKLTKSGYLYATVPPSHGMESAPTIGLVTHVDTSSDVATGPVKARLTLVTEELARQGLQLGNSAISPGDLAEVVNETVISSDGRTLLGADDKSGIAAVIDLVQRIRLRLVSEGSPRRRHRRLAATLAEGGHLPDRWPRLRLLFAPDEELARGLRGFSRADFDGAHPVKYAFTIDGSWRGEYNEETFDAWAMQVRFLGANKRAGAAAEPPVMRSAINAAADFVTELRKTLPQAETSRDDGGFVHVARLSNCSVSECTAELIVRHFDLLETRGYCKEVKGLAADIGTRHKVVAVVSEQHQYENMGHTTRDVAWLRRAAQRAYKAADVGWRVVPFRGGTHGTALAALGIAAPNLFTGARNFHSTTEFTTAESLYALANMLSFLVEALAEELTSKEL